MQPIRKVLFPTDLSEASQAAIPYVKEFARVYGCRIHVLHVLEAIVHPGEMGWTTAGIAELQSGRIDVARETLSDLMGEWGLEPNETTLDIEQGSPYQEILDYVEENGVDMIIMATHGRTGLQHFLLGSVAERVVRMSEVPVLTVRSPEKLD